MGRIYQIPLDALSVTNDADQDIWELVAPSGGPVKLHGFSLSTSTTTDERVRLRLVRRSTTGTGGSAATEVPTDDADTTTIGAALSTLVTTPGTLGETLAGWQWSQQGELLFLPTPELRPTVVASGRLALNLQTAVGSTRTWSGWVAWEEF
jgi:hypothetical protein